MGPGSAPADSGPTRRTPPASKSKRASACAHGVNVEHGDADGKSGNFRLAGGSDLTFNQRDIGRGAAHVEGDDTGEAAGAGAGGSSDHPSGGTGENGADRFAGGRSEGRDAAAGLHDKDSGGCLTG